MGIFSFLDPALGFVFNPLLNLQPFWAILIISLLISVIIVVIYKYTTNQSLMKDLKDEIKTLQKEMKELRSEPEKAMHVQKRAMETNMKYMMHSFKPTLITLLPIILIFGWLTANLAFTPLLPGEDFSATLSLDKNYGGNVSLIVPEGLVLDGSNEISGSDGSATFNLKGDSGLYNLVFDAGGSLYEKEVLISGLTYSPPDKKYKQGPVNRIKLSNTKKIVLNLFGWKLGWFGTYIFLSIFFSITLRKLLKVY